jgi:hypothetical protein
VTGNATAATAVRSTARSRPPPSRPGSASPTPRRHCASPAGSGPLSGQKEWRTVTVYAVTSLTASQATPAHLAEWIRGHWRIEALHHIRDVTYGEDASQARTGHGPRSWPSKLAIAIFKLGGATSIAAACRHHSRDAARTLATLGLIPS